MVVEQSSKIENKQLMWSGLTPIMIQTFENHSSNAATVAYIPAYLLLAVGPPQRTA